MKKTNRRGDFWLALGSLLILAALGLSLYNMYLQQEAERFSADILTELQQSVLPEASPEPSSAASAAAESSAETPAETSVEAPAESAPAETEPETLPEPETVPLYELNPCMEMPLTKVNGIYYIGTVTIPVLGLELPVAAEWSYPLLKQTPCRYMGSAYQGNLIVCAHNYDRHFGRLKNLQPGDEVRFTDNAGNVFVYAVAETEILMPTALEALRSGDWELSLFTCTRGGASRVVVRCVESAAE